MTLGDTTLRAGVLTEPDEKRFYGGCGPFLDRTNGAWCADDDGEELCVVSAVLLSTSARSLPL